MIKMMVDVKNVLNDDEIFADSVDTVEKRVLSRIVTRMSKECN